MSRLAMLGGTRAVPKDMAPLAWPIVTEADRLAVLDVLGSGKFTVASAGEEHIRSLEREWAARVNTANCVAVANGTVALCIALAAAGVGPGDEVIVPALSFIGSALAPVHLGAVPVFVDVDPLSFNLDPGGLEAARSPRTAAVLPVHLHGLPADMAEILAFARRHGLSVIEDAAQSHGIAYRGRVTGSLGDAGAFSLNMSKNLATCGEGGLITIDDDGLAERARLMRQFGEHIPDRGERPYLSRILGWNGKLSTIQAAFTRQQLTRLDAQQAARERNVHTLLKRLAGLPGLVVPTTPPDRGHGWHILRFRINAETFGLSADHAAAVRAAVTRALRAEGVPVSRYQTVPLPEQPVFREAPGLVRTMDVPVSAAVIEDSFVLQRVHLHPESGPILEQVADAMEKVWSHQDLIASMATSARRSRGTA